MNEETKAKRGRRGKICLCCEEPGEMREEKRDLEYEDALGGFSWP